MSRTPAAAACAAAPCERLGCARRHSVPPSGGGGGGASLGSAGGYCETAAGAHAAGRGCRHPPHAAPAARLDRGCRGCFHPAAQALLLGTEHMAQIRICRRVSAAGLRTDQRRSLVSPQTTVKSDYRNVPCSRALTHQKRAAAPTEVLRLVHRLVRRAIRAEPRWDRRVAP